MILDTFTQSNLKFVESIDDKILKYINVRDLQVNIKDMKSDMRKMNSSDQFNNLIKTRFIPNNIYNIIKNYKNKIFVRLHNLNICLCGDMNYDLKNKCKFIGILGSINMYLKKYSKKNIIINISIYFTNFKKLLDKSKIIGPNNINSAFTYTDKDSKNIIIFREEEWKKIFIHELIHCYMIDNFKFEKLNFIKGPDMKYEAITEYLSLILHSKLIEYLSNNKLNFKIVLKNEIKFNLLQYKKLLDFWEINKKSDFNKVLVKSSPFSYYILKTELFINKKFKNVIDKLIFDDIDILKNINLDIIKNIDIKDISNKSMRMSLYNIE